MGPTPASQAAPLEATDDFEARAAALEKAGRIDELIRACEAHAMEVAPDEAARWLTRAGQLCDAKVRDLDRAERYLRRAVALASPSKAPLESLRGLLEQRQDASGLAELLERMAALREGTERARLLTQAADLYEGKLARRGKALLCLVLASRADPEDRALSARVRAAFIDERRFRAAFDALENERKVFGDPALATEFVALAKVLAEDPAFHAMALDCLARAGALAPVDPEAQALKAEIENLPKTWRERARTLRQSSFEERDRKSAARKSLAVAKLHAKFDSDPGKVDAALSRAFLLWPAMPEALDFMEQRAATFPVSPKDKPGAVHRQVAVSLEKMADQLRDRLAQVDLLVRAGGVRLTRLQDAEGALADFERAARTDPARPEPASLAAELLLDTNRPQDAVAVLERHLEAVRDRSEQVRLNARLAQLCERALGDGKAAAEHWRKLWALEPGHPEAAAALAKWQLGQTELGGLAQWVSAATGASSPAEQSAALLREAARMLDAHEQPEPARALWSRLSALVPSDVEAAERLRAAAKPEEVGNGEKPVQPEPSEAESKAQETRAQLEKPSESADHDGAGTADPSMPAPSASAQGERGAQGEQEASAEPGALTDAEVESLRKAGKWAELSDALERAAAQASSPEDERKSRCMRAAVLGEKLGRPKDAAALWLELLGEGGSEPVMPLLRLATEGTSPLEIMRAIPPGALAEADAQILSAALEKAVAAAENPVEKTGLLIRRSRVLEGRLMDARGALDATLSALRLDPSELVQKDAARLARELSAQAEMGKALIAAAEGITDLDHASALVAKAADAFEAAGALDQAISALSSFLERAPDNVDVLSRLSQVYLAAGQAAEAEQVLRRRILAAENPEKARLYLQLSNIDVELSRPEEAAKALTEAIRCGLPEEPHLPKLADLWEQAGNRAGLAEVLDRQLEKASAAGDSDRVARLSLRRAKVEASLGNHLAAVGSYAEILERKPSDPDALAALEQLLGDPSCREEAARALLPAYGAIKDHRKLVSALETVAQSTEDPLEKVMALKKAAQVHLEQLRQPDVALSTLAQALELAPADATLRQAARAAAEAASAMDRYAALLEKLCARDLGPVRVGLYRELAEVEEKHLGSPGKAVEHLTALLALDANDVEALRILARLHRASEAFGPLADVLEKLGARVPETAEQVALFREAAQLCETRLKDPERASRNFEEVARREPLDRESASALDRLYGELGSDEALAKTLELRARQEGQSPQGRELSFRLAVLLAKRLGKPTEALRKFEEILAADPGHTGALEALEAWAKSDAPQGASALEVLDPALVRLGDHARRAAVREARWPLAVGEEKARLGTELRSLYERELKQPDQAFLCAVRGFSQNVNREALEPELERLARQTGSSDELSELYETVAGQLDPASPQATTYLRKAATLREQLGQADEAIRLWKALLQHAPQDAKALESLSRLFERSNNANSLADVYARQVGVAQDPAEKRALWIKAGAAFEESGKDDEAVEAFRAALALAPGVDALGRLDRLYAKSKSLDARVDVLAQLAALTEGDVQENHLLERGRILERDGELARAVVAYGEVLEKFPANAQALGGLERLLEGASGVEAAKRLEPHLRRQNDARRLVGVLDVLLPTRAADEKVSCIEEIAQLREQLGEKSLAFAARLSAFAEAPETEGLRDKLERLAAETGELPRLAQAFEEALARGVSEGFASELLAKLASLHADERPERAIEALEQLFKRHPKDARVLERLAALHRKANQPRELAQVMRRQVELEPSPERQVARLFELGQLAEESLSDPALAAESYQGILSRQPENQDAIARLDKVLTEAERWTDLSRLLEQEIALAEAGRRTEVALDLRVRQGRLKLTRLEDPRGALELFTRILEARPSHPGAVGALEEMARAEGPLRKEAAAALEPIFASGGEHMKLVEMLESRAAAEHAPEEKSTLLRKVAELYAGPMENVEMAFVAAAKALRELPDDPNALALCQKLAPAADAQEELAALIEEVVDKARDDHARISLYRALGSLHAAAGETAEAIEAYQKLLGLQPTDAEALSGISALYVKEGRHAELLEVLRRQLALAEDKDARAALLLEIGTLQDEALEDGLGALATFRRLLEIAPAEPRALERMDALCMAQERWPELADILAKRIAAAETDGKGSAKETLHLKFRLATLQHDRLRNRAGGSKLFEEILHEDPGHEGSIAALEALLESDPRNHDAANLLVKAHREAGAHDKLAELLESRVGVTSDRAQRKTHLAELAALRETQGEPELAFLAYFRAFKEDPNDRELRQKLERTAEAAGAYDELVACYEEELPRIAEGRDVAEIAFKLGEVLERNLDDKEQAATWYEKARSSDPTEMGPRALEALERIYTDMDRAEALAGVLEARAANAEPEAQPEVMASLWARVGALAAERLEDPDRAAQAYEKVLELDPKNLEAARKLEPIYEKAGLNQKLYEVLERQRDLTTGADREKVLTKMADVSTSGLDDPSHAVEILEELLQKNPRNEQAFHSLADALERLGRHEALEKLLVERVAHTLDPKELVRLEDRLGELVWKKLGRPEEAVPHFKAALERDARDRAALAALRELHESLDQKEELVGVLRRLLPLQEDAIGVKAIRLQVAEVLRALGRREEALDAARRALEVEPHSVPDLERVSKVFEELRAFPDAARALELRVEVELRMEERDQAVSTLFALADLWRGPAAKPAAAGKVLERILEIDPANRTAHEQVCALYTEHKDWRAYAAAVDRYLAHLVTEEEKLASLQELASVREQKLGDPSGAFLALCRALELRPTEDSIREHVERLAEETGSYEELAAVYEEVADGLPRGPSAERMYLVLARIQDEKLDEPDEAESSLRKILDFDATNAAALDALSKMFARRGKDSAYIVSLEQKLESCTSIEQRKAVLREMAQVYETRLNEPDEAAAALQRALDLEPDTETLDLLADLHRRGKQNEQLISALVRARDLSGTDVERAARQREIARVYEMEVGDEEAAIEAYAQVLAYDAHDGAALESLERLYTKLDRPSELLSVYERELDATEDPAQKVSILFRSAGIWEDRFSNLQHADACVAAALSYDPQNLQAIRTLERLRRAAEDWEGLATALEHHLRLTADAEEQAGLWVEIGDVYREQLRQVDHAADAYNAALAAFPGCTPALHALGELYERTGNWPFAIDMLQKEAELSGTGPEAVELYHRMGRMHEEMLMDPASAKGCYLKALELDPGYLPAIRALKGIHESEQDWDSYEQTLLDEARTTEDPEAKAKAFLDMARHHQQTKEDAEGAVRFYEEALRLVPDLLDAALPLADAYLGREDWEGAERMLDIVCRKMAERALADQDPQLARDLCRQLYRLGYVSVKNGKQDKALSSYEKAYQLDATYLPALEGLGHQLVAAGRLDDAQKVFQTILIHHREELTDLEVVELHWQLGEVSLQQTQPDRAENQYEKALAIDPGHEPSLRALAKLTAEAQRYDDAADYLRRLVSALDGEAKLEAALELGALARDRLDDAYMAIDAFVTGHRVDSSALAPAEALVPLYRKTRQGQKAAETLEKLLAHPEVVASPERAKKAWFELGEVARDELKEVERAAEAFNAALDLDPRFIEAFSALEAMLGSYQRWKPLEENYARMIQRLPKTEATHAARIALWRALGELYLEVLGQADSARLAYQVVAAAEPDNASVQEVYARLCQKTPGQEQEAVDAYRRALPRIGDPTSVASALAELFAKQKAYDSAYLAAQTVRVLGGKPGPGEEEILAKLSPYAQKREVAAGVVSDRQWQMHLLHPNARGPLAELCAVIHQNAGQLWAVPLSSHHVHPRKHRVDVGTAQEYQVHHYRYVSHLLGMDAVELYSPFLIATRERMAKRSGEPAPEPMVGVELCHTHPMAVKVGGRFFAESDQKSVYYGLGHALAWVRPELALVHQLGGRLEAVLQAALLLAIPGYRPSLRPEVIEPERKALDKALPRPARVAIAHLGQRWLQGNQVKGARTLAEFFDAAELTALRAGVLAAGDLASARHRIEEETGPAYRVALPVKLRELAGFAVSEDLQTLRAALGVNIQIAPRPRS